LERDDAGNLVAFIAGHSFIGSGTISLGGNRLIDKPSMYIIAYTRVQDSIYSERQRQS